jgi:hypothetical protein
VTNNARHLVPIATELLGSSGGSRGCLAHQDERCEDGFADRLGGAPPNRCARAASGAAQASLPEARARRHRMPGRSLGRESTPRPRLDRAPSRRAGRRQSACAGGAVLRVAVSVATQGDTREEAFANAKEAIELYLEIMAEDELPLPTVERGRVAAS